MLHTQVKNIHPQEAKQMLEQGVRFVDVREVEEFDQARIPGAKLIPGSELAQRFHEIPKDEPVVLYCRSGNRSEQAAYWLAGQGYDNLLNLEGGLLSWYRQGLPLDTQPLEETYSTAHYTDLTPHQAESWVKEGAYVVDVREPYEYAIGHLPGAVNLPLGRFPQSLGQLPRDRKILLVCASGGRSSSAAEYLVGQGFPKERVGNLEGGTYGWMSAGLAVER